jgi:hypothetical protein
MGLVVPKNRGCCGSEIRCLFDPWTRDSDPGSGSGMNNPDHISESLETIVWVKILMLILDPGWKNSDQGSGINIPDPQHRWRGSFGLGWPLKRFW